MALEAKRILCNAAWAAAEVCWADLIDGIALNEQVLLVPANEWDGVAAASVPYPTTVALQDLIIFEAKQNANIASVRYALQGVNIGRTPLFYRCTDVTGVVSEA